MQPPVPTGWYPDPRQPSRQRYWDGNAWTTHTREPAAAETQPAGPAPVGGGSAGASSPSEAPPDPERRPIGGTVAAVVLGTVIVGGAIAAVLYLTGILDGSDGAAEVAGAGDERTTAQDDSAAADAPGDAPGDDRDVEPVDPDEAAPAVDDLSELDPRQLTYEIGLPGGTTSTVDLDQGVAILDDGSHVRLIDELVTFGDLRGDGSAELVAAFTIDRTSDGEIVSSPAISVLTLRDREVVSLDPPPLSGSGPSSQNGLVDALGIVDGGLEVRVMTPPQGHDVIEVIREHADPYGTNPRAEIRIDHQDGSWRVTDDGPITRAVRQHLGTAGFSAGTHAMWCSGAAERRGRHAFCHLLDDDRPFDTVSLLVVDDDGGFRATWVDAGAATSALDVRAALGPGEHLCRDVEEYAAASDTPWAPVMAAVSYWFDEGMPDRMDASQNGIPCQTVFDDVASFLDGHDGRVTETYRSTVDR